MIVGNRPRVVIGDDHRFMLVAASAILRTSFEIVAAVASGEEAIAATGSLNPDVVVLDIAMPGLDGFQTAAAIRANGSAARIVFMSAHAGDDFVLKAIADGASGFVEKPRLQRELVPAVEHAMAGRTWVPSAGVLPLWRRPGGQSHSLQLYGADGFLLDSIADFFAAALDDGQSIVAVATPAHLEGVETRLSARRFDVSALVGSGRYSPVDVNVTIESVVINGAPDEARFIAMFEQLVDRAHCADGGGRPVSMFGEVAPVLCRRQQYDAAMTFERLVDAYTASHRLSVLCGYRTDDFLSAGDLLGEVHASHCAIVPAERLP